MTSEVEQARALLKAEDGAQGLVVGKDVYDPLLFSPKLLRFTAKQYLFLRAYRMGVSLVEAAHKAGMSPESAERFLDKPDVMEWMQDRAAKDYIKNEWAEPGKWWKKGDDVLEGKENWTKAQLEVWKAFGERVAPVKRETDTQNKSPQIQINIDPTAVQEAFRRQNAIEAEVMQKAS